MNREEILSHVDHTLLKPEATWPQIQTLCDEAIANHTASVCINTCYVKQAVEYMAGRIPVCCVVGFPLGAMDTASKAFEAKTAIENGAAEVDMVINIGRLKNGEYDAVREDIRAVKQAVGDKVLKVIIETCLLTDDEKRKMCDIVCEAGADYIKTSTGFSTAGANIHDVELMVKGVAGRCKVKAAGGISTEGWETLWKYCAEGKYSSDDTYKYGFDPLNKGDVAVSTFYSSSLYGKIDAAAESSEHPLKGAMTPENWDLVEIDDGTYYIAEYIGILDKAGRTEEETEAVKAFAEWFGSAETQAAWGEEFDSYPCNTAAADILYPDGIPAIYTLKNFALTKVDGTDMTYAEYVAEHSSEWTNIMTNLGFYWADASAAVAEPDWANLDWATLTQKAA